MMSYAAEDDRVLTTDSGDGSAVVTIGDGYELRLAGGSVVEWVQRVTAPTGRTVAQRTSAYGAGGVVDTEYSYLHDDHLGSTNVVSPANGNPAEAIHVANDAWGYAREGDAWQTPFTGDLDEVGVGFTGHRAALDKGLMFMRGRMYDPRAARFMSPDPIVVDPQSVQAWNPYSYVLNRPLVFTDPTGFAPAGDDCDVDICGDDDIVIGDPSGGSGAGAPGAAGADQTAPDWGEVRQTARLLDAIVPGTGIFLHGTIIHGFSLLGLGGPNPWGDHADFRARPGPSAPSRKPDPECTGRCLYAGVLDGDKARSWRSRSAEENAQYVADHIEYMNTNPGSWSVALTREIILAGGLGLLSRAVGWVRGGTALGRGGIALPTFAKATIDDVIRTSAQLRPGGQISQGARAIAKKLGHAERDGFQSAFAGINPTQANAEALMRNIMQNPARSSSANAPPMYTTAPARDSGLKTKPAGSSDS